MEDSYYGVLNEMKTQESFLTLGCFGMDERILCLTSPAETASDLSGRIIAATAPVFQQM